MMERSKSLEERAIAAYAAYRDILPEKCRGQIPMEYVGCSERAGAQYLEMALTVEPELGNVHNTLHGGLTATLFDTVMGLFTCVYGDVPSTTTVEMQTSFLHPIPMGTRLHLRAYVQSCGRNIAHARCEAFDEKNPGRILAAGTGVYFLLRSV